MARLWNALPVVIKFSLSVFKNRLKHIFQSYLLLIFFVYFVFIYFKFFFCIILNLSLLSEIELVVYTAT